MRRSEGEGSLEWKSAAWQTASGYAAAPSSSCHFRTTCSLPCRWSQKEPALSRSSMESKVSCSWPGLALLPCGTVSTPSESRKLWGSFASGSPV